MWTNNQEQTKQMQAMRLENARAIAEHRRNQLDLSDSRNEADESGNWASTAGSAAVTQAWSVEDQWEAENQAEREKIARSTRKEDEKQRRLKFAVSTAAAQNTANAKAMAAKKTAERSAHRKMMADHERQYRRQRRQRERKLGERPLMCSIKGGGVPPGRGGATAAWGAPGAPASPGGGLDASGSVRNNSISSTDSAGRIRYGPGLAHPDSAVFCAVNEMVSDLRRDMDSWKEENTSAKENMFEELANDWREKKEAIMERVAARPLLMQLGPVPKRQSANDPGFKGDPTYAGFTSGDLDCTKKIAEACTHMANIAAEKKRQKEKERVQRQAQIAQHSKEYHRELRAKQKELASRPLLMDNPSGKFAYH
jgi:hypothetical protein